MKLHLRRIQPSDFIKWILSAAGGEVHGKRLPSGAGDVARCRAPLDTPVMRDFVELLPAINALADASHGFVWRLQTEDGDATAIRVYDDPLVIFNMSVWTGRVR